MKTYSPLTDKGRTVAHTDVLHRTRDTTQRWARSQAKTLRHAARQFARATIGRELAALGQA